MTQRTTNSVSLFGHASRGETRTGSLSSATDHAAKHEPGLSLRPRITRRNTNRVSLFGHESRGETRTGSLSSATDHAERHRPGLSLWPRITGRNTEPFSGVSVLFRGIRGHTFQWSPWPHFPVESVASGAG